MIIDRHNYEELFILYWDNELTAAQKQAVEDFVKTNPDLQEEFIILGETRFTPDNFQFTEKEFLLNNSSINITNYEEQLLNYIDDELSNEERKEVEKAVSKYPVIQKELSLLQKTKLQPESVVVFPDKSTLYKREEKVRVIRMTWFRVAVAAVIILIAGLITFRIVNSGNSGEKVQVAKNSDNNNSEQKTTPSVTQRSTQSQKENEVLAKQDQNSATKDNATENKKDPPVIEDQLATNNIIVHTSGNKNNLPQEGQGKIFTDPDKIDGAVADLELLEKKEYSSPEKNEPGIIDVSLGKEDVTLQAKPALYIPEAEEKEKGGLKEFLRKTTRVFERRTKIQATTEDNKLLVGAFAVSLK